jgi:fluoroacetyl-CoA thioesterase
VEPDRLRVGITNEHSVEVTRELTIASISDALPAVYSTPAMIMLMEVAAASGIRKLLPPEHISVGVEVNIRHLAATPVGERVTASAEVIEVSGNLVRFAVKARDSRRLIGDGTHTRAIVDLSRFVRGVNR